jgi:23S rRNA pseudouridine2457 synthase
MKRYFAVYKPFGVLSQFTAPPGKFSLKDHFKVPPDVYPVGRLDEDSEGLLLLTNDAAFQHRMSTPAFKQPKEYWVQVEGSITAEAVAHLSQGVNIQIKGQSYRTLPCTCRSFPDAPLLPERIPPIRERKSIPVSWISLTIHEGKNRQVRRMTAAVGFPTLRLVRYRMGTITLDGMLPGDLREIAAKEAEDLLRGG